MSSSSGAGIAISQPRNETDHQADLFSCNGPESHSIQLQIVLIRPTGDAGIEIRFNHNREEVP